MGLLGPSPHPLPCPGALVPGRSGRRKVRDQENQEAELEQPSVPSLLLERNLSVYQ